MSSVIEKLDVKKIQDSLSPDTMSRLSKLILFETIDSTNSYLLNRMPCSGEVCLAEEQTKGRGRLGRTWCSEPVGNIYFSLGWCFSKNIGELSGLSLAIAVIVAAVLKKYDPTITVQLKWPNDILHAGKKIAGILLEGKASCVVIGIGLNLYSSDSFQDNWTSLFDMTKKNIQRNKLVGLLIDELFNQLPVFDKSGLGIFLEEWKKQGIL